MMALRSAMWAVLGVLATVPAQAATAELLAPLFQDHAVLQRDQPLPIWGNAPAGTRVEVSLGDKRAVTTADSAGHWELTLPALPAGGPFALTASTPTGVRQTATDILIGDVWLCSGQSNMELPVSRTLNAERQIQEATNNRIRVLTIAHAYAPTPQTAFQSPVSWQTAAPASIRDFSAACYFFARELQHAVPVPLGLIHAAWGGSNIEGWLSADAMRRQVGYDGRLDLLGHYAKDPVAATRELGRIWEDWWYAQVPTRPGPWQAAAGTVGEWRAVPALRDWKTWGVPELTNHDGMVWFRRGFTLSREQAAQPATLSLGGIDEVDQTWVNGQPIGNSFGWGTERTYDVPAGVLRAGENVLVVNVLSTWDAAGMYGPAETMGLRFASGPTIALGADWRYQFIPDQVGLPPRAPWQSIGGITTLYNGMIAPLGHFALRGVLWYQGESNTANAAEYQQLLTGMMSDWRHQLGSALPFLVVQLPGFGPSAATPVASDWASLREAQRRATVADPHAALAVTIDIGERRELHPPEKQEVGRRLARAARHLVYGEAVTASGPTPLNVHRDTAHVVITFEDVEGTLLSYSAADPIGFELCATDQASCRFARATLRANSVVLDTGTGEAPTRVRYCWGESPVCTLYDHSGLPAGPFELKIP